MCETGIFAMDKIKNLQVAEVFEKYPQSVQKKMMFCRQLNLDTASDEGIENLEETLKWGEPSYLVKGGSTIRIDWKKSNSKQYAMYFHCKTKLVDTFKEINHDVFRFEGNRAIVFDIDDKIQVEALKHCVKLSLTYHGIKHLSMLGVYD
jgi:hypothetical protein